MSVLVGKIYRYGWGYCRYSLLKQHLVVIMQQNSFKLKTVQQEKRGGRAAKL